MKKLRKWLLGLLIAVAALLGAGIAVGYYFQDEVEKYMVDQLNRQLNTRIHVDAISLSVLKKFPYASLDFGDIWAEDAWVKVGQRDTLFYFEHAWIQFSIAELISKDYKIRKLSLEDGVIRLKVDPDGSDNYHFWEKDSLASDTGYLDLSDIQADHILFSYCNRQSGDSIFMEVESLDASGLFANDDYNMALSGVIHNHYLGFGGENYLPDKDLAINTKLRIDKKTGIYRLAPSNMIIDEKLDFNLGGQLDLGDKDPEIDVQITGKDLEMSKAIRLLPPAILAHWSDYDFEGIMSFGGTLKGKIGNGHYPTYASSFSMSGATIRSRKADLTFNEVDISGKITSDDLKLDAFSTRIGESLFKGSAGVTNFKSPELSIRCKGDLNMKDLIRFTGSTLDTLTGRGDVALYYNGPMISPVNWDMSSLSGDNLKINGNLSDVSAFIHNGQNGIRSANGTVEVSGNDVALHNMKFKWNGTDCQTDGLFHEVLNTINDSIAPIVFEGLLNIDKLTIDAGAGSEPLSLSDRIHLNIKTNINELKWAEIEAKDISAIISGNADLFQLKLIRSSAFDGALNGVLDARSIDMGWQTAGTLNASQIDISRLFRECKNFDQQFITDKHLRGTSDIQLQFNTMADHFFVIDTQSLKANATVGITDGELIGLESMNAISDYIADHKLLNLFVKADEMRNKLADIKFNELNNTIEIRDRKVIIPRMTITSSALDLVLDGIHDFDNNFTYHYHFKVSDVLTRKDKTPGSYQVPVLKDQTVKGIRLYFTLAGTPDDFEVTHDMKAQFGGVKEQANNEKQITKSILNKEFGLFKGDTTLPSLHSLEKPPPEFTITWSEEQDTMAAGQRQPETSDTTRWGNFLKQLKKKDAQTKKEEDLFSGDDY